MGRSMKNWWTNLRGYCDHEGIMLQREKLVKNPGLHMIAKAILNSLWGKFSQNENNSVVKFVNDYEQLVTLNNNERFTMTALDFVTGKVIIASFVSSYVCLHLFELLNMLR